MDLTKLSLHSAYPSFKNKNIYEGSFNISGTYENGIINFRTHIFPLPTTTDITNTLINGRVLDVDFNIHTDRWGYFPVVSTPVYLPSLDITIEQQWFSILVVDGADSGILMVSLSSSSSDVPDGAITSTTINYRTIDNTIAGGPSSDSDIEFDSKTNYLKKGFSGSTNLTLPGAAETVSHTVNHGLGYIPFFHVGGNINNTSVVWSNDRIHEFTTSFSATEEVSPELSYYITEQDLVITILNGYNGGEQSGSRTIYWNIYLDYSS